MPSFYLKRKSRGCLNLQFVRARWFLTSFFIWGLHKHDGDGNENVKKAMGLDRQAMAVQAMDNALVSLIPIRRISNV